MNLETLAERHCTAQNLAHGTYMFGLPQLRELIKEAVGEPVAKREYDAWDGYEDMINVPNGTTLYAINLEEL